VPLKIYSLHHDGLYDPEYESRRDVVRLYPTRLIEEELIRIAETDNAQDKNYVKALFDEYVFQRIDCDARRVVMSHYASIIQDELLKKKFKEE
jgi:hypothetical protein